MYLWILGLYPTSASAALASHGGMSCLPAWEFLGTGRFRPPTVCVCVCVCVCVRGLGCVEPACLHVSWTYFQHQRFVSIFCPGSLLTRYAWTFSVAKDPSYNIWFASYMNVLFCIIWFILTHTKGYTINTLIHSMTGHHSVTYLLLSKILGLIFWVLFDGGLGLRGWGLQHFDQRDCQCGAQSRSVHKFMLHKWRTMLVHHPFKVFYTYMYTHCYCVEGACTCTCTMYAIIYTCTNVHIV